MLPTFSSDIVFARSLAPNSCGFITFKTAYAKIGSLGYVIGGTATCTGVTGLAAVGQATNTNWAAYLEACDYGVILTCPSGGSTFEFFPNGVVNSPGDPYCAGCTWDYGYDNNVRGQTTTY